MSIERKFFFCNADAVSAYVKAHCNEEMEKIIEAADLMAENTLLFNLRWDMEQTHVPICFENEIDWLHRPGDDPEWTYAANRMRAWVCMGQAYAITADEKYPCAFVRQMRHWVNTVRQDDPKAANAWRSIEVGIRLETWLKTFEYMKKSPAVTDEAKAIFTKSIIEHAEFIMEVWNGFNLLSNWGVLANHGLFLAGVMLSQNERTAEYVRVSVERLQKCSKIQIYPDGVHWEQSPMYHNEVLRCFLDVLILARRNNIDLPPVIAANTRKMLYASFLSGKPNGHEIMMGDSDDIDQRDLITIGASLFSDGMLKWGGYPRLDFDSAWTLGSDEIKRYDDIVPMMPQSLNHSLSDSGNFYFRSDWSEDAIFVHFHCGTLGGGHGHADKLHFDLFANGEDIFIDPGRYTYVPKEERYFYKRPCAHNTITVDGIRLYEPNDSWAVKNLGRLAGRKMVERGGYIYIEGSHLGFISDGVFAERKMIQLEPGLLLICDAFHGSHEKMRTYRQHFQWNNLGDVSGQECSYVYSSQKNTATIELISEENIETELVPSRISRHYNRQEASIALKTKISADGFASVFSVISIDKAGDEIQVSAKKEQVQSSFYDSVFSHKDIEALTITKGTKKYTAVIAHREFASPTDLFNVGDCIGFGHVVVFDRNEVSSSGEVLVL